ncbi:hypothetical protein Q5762_08605 [Streptomyces sp. P9(2023)]|uniref:hypothetical protein n=1 Tax=Streptomyces sp. P9(2023) TaxID=3064394 RepID=UPI0028F4056F|nr:hypothetical protein [Streptomyces sp. P9(2023)]MDT9688416.1 hypothetical protein [Streptomyces sp. P9(2023)]
MIAESVLGRAEQDRAAAQAAAAVALTPVRVAGRVVLPGDGGARRAATAVREDDQDRRPRLADPIRGRLKKIGSRWRALPAGRIAAIVPAVLRCDQRPGDLAGGNGIYRTIVTGRPIRTGANTTACS